MSIMTTNDFSTTVGTTAQTVLTPAQTATFKGVFLRVFNASATATIWLNRNGLAVVNGAGSYSLAPGVAEVYGSATPVPDNALSAVASAAGGALTIEAV